MLPHLKEDLAIFCTDFHEGVEVACCWWDSQSIEVVRFEGLSPPGTTVIGGRGGGGRLKQIMNGGKEREREREEGEKGRER